MDDTKQPERLFAIVSLFGHDRIAGEISEHTFGGGKFLRVDVPEIVARAETNEGDVHLFARAGIAAHTKTFGAAAVFSIDWVDQETARIAAYEIRHQPLNPYSVRKAINELPTAERHALLTSHRERTFDDDGAPF